VRLAVENAPDDAELARLGAEAEAEFTTGPEREESDGG
jgi:hypothetical protein